MSTIGLALCAQRTARQQSISPQTVSSSSDLLTPEQTPLKELQALLDQSTTRDLRLLLLQRIPLLLWAAKATMPCHSLIRLRLLLNTTDLWLEPAQSSRRSHLQQRPPQPQRPLHLPSSLAPLHASANAAHLLPPSPPLATTLPPTFAYHLPHTQLRSLSLARKRGEARSRARGPKRCAKVARLRASM